MEDGGRCQIIETREKCMDTTSEGKQENHLTPQKTLSMYGGHSKPLYEGNSLR